jgi:hypothetical protein
MLLSEVGIAFCSKHQWTDALRCMSLAASEIVLLHRTCTAQHHRHACHNKQYSNMLSISMLCMLLWILLS